MKVESGLKPTPIIENSEPQVVQSCFPIIQQILELFSEGYERCGVVDRWFRWRQKLYATRAPSLSVTMTIRV